MTEQTQDSPYRLQLSTPDMVEDLAVIQKACFPTLSDEELITAEDYAAQIARYPEGQMCIIDTRTGRPVASSTDLRRHVDLDHLEHRFLEAIGDNTLSAHEPDGDWLYGADIGVHPDHRRKGLSTMLYNARHDLIRREGLMGHVAGGYLAGYGEVAEQMSVEDYVLGILAGSIWDPTASIQLKRGYKCLGVIHHYVDDPVCDNKGLFILWPNPDRHPPEDTQP